MKFPTWFRPASHLTCGSVLVTVMINGFPRGGFGMQLLALLLALAWNVTVLSYYVERWLIKQLKLLRGDRP